MRKSNSDTAKVREVLKKYGYAPYKFYSESRKNHRRVKAWICAVTTEDLSKIKQDLSDVFGERFLLCYNMVGGNGFRQSISFIVELAP